MGVPLFISHARKDELRYLLMLQLTCAFSNAFAQCDCTRNDHERRYMQELVDAVRECIENETDLTQPSLSHPAKAAD